MHEPLTNLRKLIVIQMKSDTLDAEIWRALYGASSYSSSVGKMTIAVNEDIDPENLDMVMWAMAYRMRPHQDMRVLDHKDMGHGPRAGAEDNHYEANNSAMLINAMLKRPYPPISLPAREYMEKAKAIWQELGLPALKPETPWFGYSLGQWPEEFQVEADRADAQRILDHRRSDQAAAAQRQAAERSLSVAVDRMQAPRRGAATAIPAATGRAGTTRVFRRGGPETL